jgi:hypothetical protein
VVVFLDGPCEHHEEGEENVEVVWLGQSLIDFCQKLAEDVGTGLIIYFFGLVVFGLLLLGVEVDIYLVEIAFHVDFLEGAVVLPLLGIGDKVTQPIDAVGRDVFGITVTIVDFFLSG